MSNSILVIAEKPSVAQSLAQVIGANKREDGYLSGAGYIVSWCVGHLIGLSGADVYDEKYAKWSQADLPILPNPWQYSKTMDKKKQKQLSILKKLMNDKNVETVICATDAGREGELIFRLVYDYCGCTKPVKRLWISSMEESAISNGFKNLKDSALYDNLYKSALCRTQADWLVGINATRLFSCLYGSTLSVGRVQTPTLAMIVERDLAIETFIKTPFYTPVLELDRFKAFGKKSDSREAADEICSCCAGKEAFVFSAAQKEKGTASPKLYDLTTLQREANRLLGYTASQTLETAQSLYEKKLITYPRTDSKYLTEDMATELPVLALDVFETLPFLLGVKKTMNPAKVIDNTKVSDHHAIIPTKLITNVDINSLLENERNILYMIVARLVCAIHEDYIYLETYAVIDCEGYRFKAKDKTDINMGFKGAEMALKKVLKCKLDDSSNDDKPPILPEFTEGKIFKNVKSVVNEGFTAPPKKYTDDLLLGAMENTAKDESDVPSIHGYTYGIGTPATRAGIIEKLIKSGFVERKNKNLTATEKGKNLISVLPDSVKSPALTTEWEHMLGLIEKGELKDSDFILLITYMTDNLVKANNKPLEEYKHLFETKCQGKAIGTCPCCGTGVFENTKGYFCEDKDCGFALWKDNKFFTSKRKKLDAKTAAALLKEGRIFISGLYSESKDKTYDATVVLNNTGKYVKFKLEFKND